MMKLFKLVGTQSILKLNLEHPIHLNEDENYEIALAGFYSDNNIFNLTEDGEMYFQAPKESVYAFIPFKKGYWTIENIQHWINLFIKNTEYKIKIEKDGGRIKIISPYYSIGFNTSMAKMLGYTLTNSPLDYKGTFSAENPPNLRTVDVIEIHCNIVERSMANHDLHWHKHDEREILHFFFPNVSHGSKISEKPPELLFIPLKKNLHRISEIIISIQDQDNNLLQNPDVNNIVYLILRKK